MPTRSAESAGSSSRGQDGGSPRRGPPSPASPLALPGLSALTAEERVVLLTGRLDPPVEDVEAAAALARRPGFDWDRLVDLACRHWVHPLLARVALDPDSPLEAILPDSSRTPLQMAGFAARTRWRSYLSAMEPVMARWEAAGIRPVLLKGAALQATLYPEGARLLNDLDLWVPPERMDEACAALAEEGFSRDPTELALSDEVRARMPARTYGRRPAGALIGLAVDIHDRLFREDVPCALDPLACAEAGEVVPWAGGSATVFRREDAIVLLAGHVVKEMVVKLLTVADLAVLLGAGPGQPPPDLSAVEARALEAGAAGPTALALRWARAAGAHVPDDVLDRLDAAAAGARGATAVLLDARAVLERFRLRAVPRRALKTRYGGGARRVGAFQAVRTGIRDSARAGGAGRMSAGLRAARSAPLVALSLGGARVSATLQGRGAHGAAGRVNGLFWAPTRGPEPEAGTGLS